MRLAVLLGLLVVGCDTDKADETPDTTPEDTVEDTDTTPDTEDTDTVVDTGDEPEDTAPPEDTAVVSDDPCEGRTVGVREGECAQNFSMVDKDGVTHTLHDYAGQVVLLDFSGFT